MNEKIVIGKILKPQGIKGELKILPITNDISRFKRLKEIYIGDSIQCEIEWSRIDTTNAYIKLKGYDDRNSVEAFKDKYILVDRKDAVKLPEGSYFVVDLIGLKVVVDSKIIGVLSEVLDYTGSTDTYVVNLDNNKQMMFPALKSVIKLVDIDNQIIELDKQKLEEVAVYED